MANIEHYLPEMWVSVSCNKKGRREHNNNYCNSISREGRPSTRMVLLNGFHDNGLQFFTNFTSKKGRDLVSTFFSIGHVTCLSNYITKNV